MGRLVAIALIVAAGGIAAIAVNGPGKDKPKTDKLTPSNESSQVTGGGVAGQSGPVGEVSGTPTVTIRMKHLRFIPSEVNVPAGGIVRFVNDDDVVHTVVENVGARSGVIPAFESLRISPGQHFQIAAKPAGQILPFICTIHPTVMSGQIYVKTAGA